MSTGRAFPSPTTCATRGTRRPSCTSGYGRTTPAFGSSSSACYRSSRERLLSGSTSRKYYPGNIDVVRLVWYRLGLTATGETIPVTSDRKTAIAAYKERKTFAGIFVI